MTPTPRAQRDAARETLARIRADLAENAAFAFARLAADYLARASAGEGAVSSVPADAAARFRFDPSAPPASLDDVVAELASGPVADANRLWHPMYMGHQVAAPLPAAIWAESVLGALNNSLAVREMSPGATPVELALVRWLCSLVWGEAAAVAAGTFTSGGTEAIFTSLLAARNAALPGAAEDGVRGPAAIVCGEHAHYAVRRAAGQIGLGSRGAVSVSSPGGHMDAHALEAALDALARDGVPVVAVVATAGTTATGAFDDLERIGTICEARGLWLHVDAAHGGSALLSSRNRHRLAGIERAHSISWDAHKMMLMPLAAGVVLIRDARRLHAAFGQDAPYLFARRDGSGEEVDGFAGDQGLRSFMCSRRADAVKVWVALRRYGVDGIAAIHDALCDRTAELHGILAAHPAFDVPHEPESNILCFRYVGSPRLPAGELDALNLALRERWNASGKGWITTTVLDGRRVLRVVIMNPLTESRHLGALVDGLGSLAGVVSPPGSQPVRS